MRETRPTSCERAQVRQVETGVEEGREIDVVNACRLCRGTPRNPHPHRTGIHAHISFLLLLVHGHVHAIMAVVGD